MKRMSMVAVMVLAVMLGAGCASHPDRDAMSARDAGGLGMYSPLDATAQIYTLPRTAAPVEDNVWRYLGFVLHPVGLALDYAINRPFYALASTFPTVFGYTSEDALVDARRTQ